MDLQTRKILFVQEFLKLESENIVTHLENLLITETENFNGLSPMSIEEYKKRIEESLNDSLNGRLTETIQLQAEIEKWS
ncbi:MAG: hypothetical protein WCI53_09295 [Bacteroidota bacterium]|jgi:hypothetical protein